MCAAKSSSGTVRFCDFDELCSELDHRDCLNERKETRRHQSLGEFAIPDESKDIFNELDREQLISELKVVLGCLSERQYFVLFNYSVNKMSFRAIGELLGLHKDTIREHYHSSVKKLQKFLKKHPVKLPLSWLLGGGLKSLP